MALAVNRQPLSIEAQIQSQASAHGICDGQSGTGTGFSLGMLVFPCQFHSTNAPCSFIQLPLTIYNHSNESVIKDTHTMCNTNTTMTCTSHPLNHHANNRACEIYGSLWYKPHNTTSAASGNMVSTSPATSFVQLWVSFYHLSSPSLVGTH